MPRVKRKRGWWLMNPVKAYREWRACRELARVSEGYNRMFEEKRVAGKLRVEKGGDVAKDNGEFR